MRKVIDNENKKYKVTANMYLLKLSAFPSCSYIISHALHHCLSILRKQVTHTLSTPSKNYKSLNKYRIDI